MRTRRLAGRRLFIRLMTLVIISVVAYLLQQGYEEEGQIYLLVAEYIIYAVGLVVFLHRETGRLKSGPDTSNVSWDQLREEDSSAGVYIALYLFLLMLGIVVKVIFIGRLEDATIGPWGIFIAIAPIFIIVFWRQYLLERRRESTLVDRVGPL